MAGIRYAECHNALRNPSPEVKSPFFGSYAYYYIYIIFKFSFKLIKKAGKWAQGRKTAWLSQNFVPTFENKSGQSEKNLHTKCDDNMMDWLQMSYKIGMIAFCCPPLPTFSESTVTKVGKFSRTLLDKQHLLHTIDIVGVPGTPVRVSGGRPLRSRSTHRRGSGDRDRKAPRIFLDEIHIMLIIVVLNTQ